MISCQTIMQIIEKLAPKKLAYDWDNPGLAIGDFSQKVKKVLFVLTVTPKIVDYAVKNGYDMIISHHPLLFKPLKSIRRDLPQGEIIYNAIKNDIIVYSAHTNLDIANGGVNDVLVEAFDLRDVQVLSKTKNDRLKKVVVFVPESHKDVVRTAMIDVGAGFIGNYSKCTFNTKGYGTFKPEDNTNPYIGEKGKLEKVSEVRIETIVPESKLKKVINAMLKAHPYEEVAYDIYPLENRGKSLGIGRIGYLKKSITLKEFCELVKVKLDTEAVRVVGDLSRKIQKVAVSGGSGASLIPTALFQGADVILTGDIKYHDALDAQVSGIAVVDAGHFPTENIVLPKLADFVNKEVQKLGKDVKISIYKDKDPFVVV